jgi:hypothetical protein
VSVLTRDGLAGLAGLALALGAGADAGAAEPATAAKVPAKDVAAELAADEELLEFLGGADGELEESGDWLDFLSNTDIRKVAGAKR